MRRPATPRRVPDMRAGRVAPAALIALAAFAVGAGLGAVHVPPERDVAERYLEAWQRGDHTTMHDLLTPQARRAVGPQEFRAAVRGAAITATATRLEFDDLELADGTVSASAAVPTRVFGNLTLEVRLGMEEVEGEPRIAWRPHHSFPGLRPGERLSRDTRLPERGALLARDGTRLAAGPLRTSELGVAAASVVGELGAVPRERADRLQALGWPDDAQVGVSGLERAFDERVAGRPGGELLAGERVLASARPRPGEDVRTSVSVAVQEAAVEALAGRLGGIVALAPATGEVLASSGIGLEGLQPPGSTFKVVTLAGALEAGITETGRRYEPMTAATLEGVELQNANGALCGGTLLETFAESCNSVYAPMGAQLGAQRLVEAAEDFGFNAAPGVGGAAAVSTLPPAGEIGDDLAVGATAIGQGRVQATALQMALVSAVIAREGVLPQASFVVGGSSGEGERTIAAEVARTVERLMVAAVEEGTGAAAAIPGVRVAGKTGTAELRATQGECPPACGSDPTDTSAWFLAHAPTGNPKVAVAALLVQGGSGGETAAPAAAEVLRAGLRRPG